MPSGGIYEANILNDLAPRLYRMDIEPAGNYQASHHFTPLPASQIRCHNGLENSLYLLLSWTVKNIFTFVFAK